MVASAKKDYISIQVLLFITIFLFVVGLPVSSHAGQSRKISEPKQPSLFVTSETDPLLALAMTIFGSAAISSTKESACVGSQIYDIKHFPEPRGLASVDVQRWARATVRIRLNETSEIEKLFQSMPASKRADRKSFSMGGFEYLGTDGFCSGTLISDDIIVTAAHCVSRAAWRQDKGVEYPYYATQGEKKYLSVNEFAKFLVVEFNYQDQYVASNSIASSDAPFPQRVLELFAPKEARMYPNPEGLDYALLRIKSTRTAASLSLDVKKLGSSQSQGPAIVIQHPEGQKKKVSFGNFFVDNGRIAHTASTGGASSGAGILDYRGNLIGVHTDRASGKCGVDSNNIGLPLSRIKNDIERAVHPR